MMNKDTFKSMCNAYTDDEVCNACCNNLVMEKQACYAKPSERAKKALNGRDGEQYCEAVQKVLDVLCGVCGKCNEKEY